jgi:hypothetical protein
MRTQRPVHVQTIIDDFARVLGKPLYVNNNVVSWTAKWPFHGDEDLNKVFAVHNNYIRDCDVEISRHMMRGRMSAMSNIRVVIMKKTTEELAFEAEARYREITNKRADA